MVPEAESAGDLGSPRQRVDHPCVGGPGGGYDHNRDVVLRAIVLDNVAQRIKVHASGPVRRYKALGRASYARLVRDFEPGKVAFPGDVKYGSTVKGAGSFCGEAWVTTGQSANERGEVGLCSTIGEMARRLLRQTGASGKRIGLREPRFRSQPGRSPKWPAVD